MFEEDLERAIARCLRDYVKCNRLVKEAEAKIAQKKKKTERAKLINELEAERDAKQLVNSRKKHVI